MASKRTRQTRGASSPQTRYPRDLIGYAGKPPHPRWPGDARVAVQFVINYEEGGENSILHGDPASEAFLSEMIGAQPLYGVRHMSMESLYEYGSRAGFWRLHDMFVERGLTATIFAVAMALERNPAAAKAMMKAGFEIASHGWRWIDYQYVDPAIEREHIKLAVASIERVTGVRPLGWYTGRTSPNTRTLVAEHGGFLYDADSYADELPYWEAVGDKAALIVPYTLDANDMRFASPQGFNSGDQFFAYLKDSFDVLYAEGKTRPKMMSIGLHCRLAGRPGRAASLARFLDYVAKHEQVWVCRRLDIARHWREHHPYDGPSGKTAS
jgi:putative urate catabolism protein